VGKKYLPQVVAPIKRVLPQDGLFICGICQETHDDWSEALHCLRNCWSAFLTLAPVVVRRMGLKTLYRCRYCARAYQSHAQANLCSVECFDIHCRQFDLEWGLLELVPTTEKKRRPQKLVAVVQKAPPKLPRQPKKSEENTVIAPDESSAPPAPANAAASPTPPAEAAPQSSPAKAPEPAPPAAPSGKKGKETGFYRDGARYVCEVCNSKFFTKEEVSACFNSHT